MTEGSIIEEVEQEIKKKENKIIREVRSSNRERRSPVRLTYKHPPTRGIRKDKTKKSKKPMQVEDSIVEVQKLPRNIPEGSEPTTIWGKLKQELENGLADELAKIHKKEQDYTFKETQSIYSRCESIFQQYFIDNKKNKGLWFAKNFIEKYYMLWCIKHFDYFQYKNIMDIKNLFSSTYQNISKKDGIRDLRLTEYLKNLERCDWLYDILTSEHDYAYPFNIESNKQELLEFINSHTESLVKELATCEKKRSLLTNHDLKLSELRYNIKETQVLPDEIIPDEIIIMHDDEDEDDDHDGSSGNNMDIDSGGKKTRKKRSKTKNRKPKKTKNKKPKKTRVKNKKK